MQAPPRLRVFVTLWLTVFTVPAALFAQSGFKINIPKPKEYEDRVLRSEKSTDGKLGYVPKLVQNTVTHYNYTFNATRKLNEVLDRAKAAYKDDYSQLISFYNYQSDVIKADSLQLDSVMQKASSGIALHDLRNDWVDNLYLLWGAAYYFQQKYDSAYQLFQFINYSFAPKEKDGYYKVIGSGRDGNKANSIATKEKKKVMGDLFSTPPSRNDALIWQIRTHLAQDQYAEAASLIEALRKDAAFPKRLKHDLDEVTALQFYEQGIWDSAAFYLSGALEQAPTRQEKTRWEYLTAQLYEKAGRFSEAHRYYQRTIPHTTDLILEIYARLGAIRTNWQKANADIERNVNTLLDMAQKEKYAAYRDIILYMAAQMDLAGNNTERAIRSLLSSTRSVSNSPAQRNKAFLQLAELSYRAARYGEAYNFYDSIDLKDSSLINVQRIKEQKRSLGLLATQMDIITRQDSLARIAALPEEDRKEWVKKLVRDIKKQQGISEDPSFAVKPALNPLSPPAPQSLFNGAESKGEWYFYNASSRSRGLAEFKSRWGNRPNMDNWRRMAALQSMMNATTGTTAADSLANAQKKTGGDIDFESLYAQLPLTPEQKRKAQDSLSRALFSAGNILVQEIEDCEKGTALLERLLSTDTAFTPLQAVYFNLYRCYQKSGQVQKAAAVKARLIEQYPNDPITQSLTRQKKPVAMQQQADSTYEQIYQLFSQGYHQQALEKKQQADSLYGPSFWTPQLLYIESVYYVQQRQDSTAIRLLYQLRNRFTDHPMAAKALQLLEALSKRAAIEASLQTSESPTVSNASGTPATAAVNTSSVSDGFIKDSSATHLVVLILDQVDPVLVTETRNAIERYNKNYPGGSLIKTEVLSLGKTLKLVKTSPFANQATALQYKERTSSKTLTEIAPWLSPQQYYWIIVATPNWDRIRDEKELESYKSFLNKNRP